MKGIIIKLFKLNLSSSYKSKLIGYDRDEMGHDLIYATPSTLLIFSLSLSTNQICSEPKSQLLPIGCPI